MTNSGSSVNFGSLIKARREMLGMTQTVLADKMKLEQQTIMRYENNEHDPPLSKIKMFWRTLEINDYDMFDVLRPDKTKDSVKEKEQKYETLDDTLKSIEHFAKLEPAAFKKLNLKHLTETIAKADKRNSEFLIKQINNLINHFNHKE